MKFLLLNGHGIDIRVDSAKLCVKNGFYSMEQGPEVFTFKPRQIDVDHIVIYGPDGNISIDAIRWLMKHSVQVSVLNWNGDLLTTMLPPQSISMKTRLNQYQAYLNEKERLILAKEFIKGKFARTKEVLNYLKEKYLKIDTDFSSISKRLEGTNTIGQLMQVEGHVAHHYWQQITKILPKEFEFTSRYTISERTHGAGDQINALLNYGYSILEAECHRAIQTNNLEASIGFMHEQRSGKNALAYDLQEPFRFLIDLAVIKSIEEETFTKKDFIRTENYNLRLRPEGAKKLIRQIELQFNSTVDYKGKQPTWRYTLLEKTRELTNYLNKTSKDIDFCSPKLEISHEDTEHIRNKIRSITYSEWKAKGYSKGTLHYLKANTKTSKNFKIYTKALEKIQTIDI